MSEQIQVVPPTSDSISVAVIESSSVPHRHKDVHLGNLGRGYNILNGNIKSQLFDEIKAKFSHCDEKRNENHAIFKDFQEYEREIAKKIGLDYEDGMLSLWTDNTKYDPFLCIDKVDNTKYLWMEIEENYYQLDFDNVNSLKPKFLKEQDIVFALEKPFSETTKSDYYNFFEKYGTHFIKRVTFGAKAEICWGYNEQFFDILDKVTRSQKYKKKFISSVNKWKDSNYSDPCQSFDKVPSPCVEVRRSTNNFHNLVTDKTSIAEQIGFQVEEISVLFEDPQLRNNFEIAIKVYIEEMKPIRDLQKLNDGAIVGLYNPDTKRWVKTDPSGHLWLSNSLKVHLDCKYEAKKKGSKVGLKSMLYGKKLISRGMTKSSFNFHRLQFIGPHESFQLSGDYLMICGNLTAPTYLYASDSDEIFHDGSVKKRSRFLLLSLENRVGTDQEHHVPVGEPSYDEDLIADVRDDSDFHERTIINTKSDPITEENKLYVSGGGPTPVYKANSTSSLFIKETIHLPNIDEMTRRMAAKLLHMMRDIDKNSIEIKRFDIFNEEQFPLTSQSVNFKSVAFETVFHFLNTIFKVEKLAPETSVMSMIYLQRVLLRTKINLTTYNWRRMSLSTLILAAKVFEDLAVWNVDFVELFPGMGVQDLNKLEKHLLQYLDFNVSFTRQEYATEYFDLCNYSSKEVWEGKPLDEEALKSMEVKSAASERIHLAKVHKSVSITVMPSKSFKKDTDPKTFAILS